MKYKHLILSLSLIMLGPLAHAEEIGSVDTVFKMIGPDHKIVVEAFDDPDVKNVTCYVSRAKTGGIKGGLGLAEDTSDAAISCQQVGPIELSDRIKNGKAQGEVVFKKRTSLVFKSLQVVRFYDACNFAFFSGLIGAQFWAERAQPKSPELDAKLLVSC